MRSTALQSEFESLHLFRLVEYNANVEGDFLTVDLLAKNPNDDIAEKVLDFVLEFLLLVAKLQNSHADAGKRYLPKERNDGTFSLAQGFFLQLVVHQSELPLVRAFLQKQVPSPEEGDLSIPVLVSTGSDVIVSPERNVPNEKGRGAWQGSWSTATQQFQKGQRG